MQTEAENALTREIGVRLRYARHSKGLSLGQLSALTGGALSKSRISNGCGSFGTTVSERETTS